MPVPALAAARMLPTVGGRREALTASAKKRRASGALLRHMGPLLGVFGVFGVFERRWLRSVGILNPGSPEG